MKMSCLGEKYIFNPQRSKASSETKEARTVRLCTNIAYYIVSVTKQLKFLDSHSTVCSQVLYRKMKFTWLIALSTRIPKYNWEALISGEGQPENFEKISNNRASIVMQIGGWLI